MAAALLTSFDRSSGSGRACFAGLLGALAKVTRHWWAKAFWIIWPAWVWFAVMATGNHFWLDCLAGSAVALISMSVVYRWDKIRGLLFGSGEETSKARTA